MAARGAQKARPIIIKRIEEDGHDGHHGGAWKVAYADFVTAMMAFFLLLWILSSASKETLEGLANYFAPTTNEQGGRGGEGILSGTTMGPEGVFNSSSAPFTMIPNPNFGVNTPQDDSRPAVTIEYEAVDASHGASEREDSQEALAELYEMLEGGGGPIEGELAQQQADFEKLAEQIKQAISAIPELAPLLQNIIFTITEEGLKIDILDHDKTEMFAKGRAVLNPQAEKLMTVIGKAVATLPNRLIITGHTDASPYRDGAKYTNWELSADRANASRRVVMNAGVSADRMVRVSGVADTELLVKDDPQSAANRRMSFTLMYTEALEKFDPDLVKGRETPLPIGIGSDARKARASDSSAPSGSYMDTDHLKGSDALPTFEPSQRLRPGVISLDDLVGQGNAANTP